LLFSDLQSPNANPSGEKRKKQIMKSTIQLKTTTPPLLITVALLCFGLLPRVQAVVPAPDGGYPGFNTAEGQKALFSLTTGQANTAVGWFSLWSNDGSFNTATGAGALLFNTADGNTAFGTAALLFNTVGVNNAAVGAAALLNNTEGNENTATSSSALLSNTTGGFNTANGAFALFSNTEGGNNTATGSGALFGNTIGNGNTATGSGALRVNTTGASNTAIGVRALFINNADNNTATGYTALLNNTDGVDNTATGYQALLSNTTGSQNTAVGAGALASADDSIDNVAVGFGALSDANGGDCIALGAFAGSNVTTAFNVIAIGHSGLNVDDTTWIDNIYGVTTQSGTTLPVVVSNQGQLGTASSSRRFKKEVKPMDNASEAVLALKPVTFQYKTDNTSTPQFGLIAEDVAAVDPNLVVRDENGEIYTVRYDAVNAMLLNEFLKEHRKVEEQNGRLENQAHKIQEQGVTIAELKKAMETVVARLKEQDSKIQRVSNQLEINRPGPQVVQIP
jgi:hypothetical protein